MNPELVEEYFENIGTNIILNYETTNIDGLVIRTGAIDVRMTVSQEKFEEIPYATVIHRRNVLITMRGRPIQCLGCHQLGHRKSQCPKFQHRGGPRDAPRDAPRDRPGNRPGQGPELSFADALTGRQNIMNDRDNPPQSDEERAGSESTQEGGQVLNNTGDPPWGFRN